MSARTDVLERGARVKFLFVMREERMDEARKGEVSA